jgi:putative hydrolase
MSRGTLSNDILPTPDQDMHVHSTYSDGRGTVHENLVAAELCGLTRMTCVDHVRASTDWVSGFIREVRHAAAQFEIAVGCGLEAKLLDLSGRLDLPPDSDQADYVYIADHQVPLADGPATPSRVREAIAAEELDAPRVIAAILEATTNAIPQVQNVVLAHLFSVLPKLGIRESEVPIEAIQRLARVAANAGALVEIDERWRCPSARTLRPFLLAGVPIVLSSDSHQPSTIGRYDYCLETLAELATGRPR